MKKKYLCPCCKKYEFVNGPGSYEICPVCSWEDDKVQADNPDYKGGANKLSLNECIKKFNSVIAVFLMLAMLLTGLVGCGNASDTGNASQTETDSQQMSASIREDDSSTSNTSKQTAALKFRNENLLNSHYEKHGKEMGFKSAKEYEKAAAAVVNNSKALHKKEAEDGDDVYYVESTNEFVIVSTDGYIRTYFKPDAGISYYNRQ